MRRIFLVALVQLMTTSLASAFTAPAMLKDINPGGSDSSPVGFLLAGNKLVFFASDGATGCEPWVSDGTAGGTFLLRDSWPGAYGGFNPYCPSCNAVSNGNIVYFSASDGSGGSELWRTDGTSLGTAKVYAGASAYGLGIVGNKVFFTANSGLYASDGTPGGTARVSDTALSSGDELLDVGGIAYFTGTDGYSGIELWRSDGTSGGTYRVKDINPGSPDANPTNLTNVGGTLYFTATNGTGGALYKTDGTSLGTVLIRQGGITGAVGGGRKSLANANGIVYFVGVEATHGSELWRSDGTPAGTYMVKDIYPGEGGGVTVLSSALVMIGSTVYLNAADDTHGYELWKSDGTEAGTVMVTDINPGITSSSPKQLANINGTLFFRAQSSYAAGDQPWTSDGTAAGTQQWAAIRPADASNAGSFTLAGGNLFFAANDGTNGLELWKSGPTLGVGTDEPAIGIVLSQSRPNPMHSRSSITYALPVEQHVTLKLYDIQGRELRTLVDQMQGAGMHRAEMDGRGVANGVYFYRLSTPEGVREHKLVIQN